MLHRRLPQRLALGAALSLSLAHCADLDSQESEGALPGDTTDTPKGTSTPDTSTNQNPSVVSAPGLIKLPKGVDTRVIKHWFIELEGVPLAQAGDPDALIEAAENFRASAYDAALAYQERMRFDGLVHGISVRMDDTELGKLGQVKGIKAVYPIGTAYMPKLQNQNRPAMASATRMTGADIVQNDLGFDGSGIRVGVIDSGIDLDHPDFHVGGTLAGASRIDLTKSYDFVGDNYDAGADEPGESTTPTPDALPDDCGGHGTHVSGIIGASGNPATGGVVGVAPGVTFHAYRVFGCDGSVNDDIIAAAIERAFSDGADVINLSLGSDNGWATDFSALALSRAADLGIVAVAAAGNNGGNGPWTLGSPGGGEHTITAASVDNAKLRANKLEFSDGRDVAYATLTGAPATPTTGSIGPIVYVGRGCLATATAPEDAYLANPNGKVAMIVRGACTFAEKYARAKAAGATAIVIQNNLPNDPPFAGSLGTVDVHDLIGVMIGQADGEALKTLIGTNPDATINWTADFLETNSPTGGEVSGFSSWGPAPELLLKPDVAAPGGDIRSTWPLSRTDGEAPGYAILSGTSMASPHVAGAVALLLEAKPNLSPARALNLIQNSAEPIVSELSANYLAPVHHQGAGLLRIDLAVKATTLVSPSKVFAGEGENGPVDVPLYLENQSNASATYTFGLVSNALATAGDPFNPQGPDYYLPGVEVEFLVIGAGGNIEVTDSITIPAGGVRTVGVRITPPSLDDAPEGTVYGGYFTLTPQEGATATAVSVPFAGIVGDYQAIDPIGYPVAGLAEPLVMLKDSTLIEDPTYVYEAADVADAGHTFSMKDGDVPTGIIKLAHPVQKWTAELVPHGKLAWLGPIQAFEVTQMRRDNLVGRGFVTAFAASDLGVDRMPDGVYHVRMKLLKALGTVTDPDHVVTLESAPFRVDRTAEAPAP